jgi:hypothetical protein
VVAAVVTSGKDAAKVLLEADARLFRSACGIGIEGLEKTPDFLLDPSLLVARRDDLPWLDVVVHFPLHLYSSPEKHRFSFQGDPDPNHCHKHVGYGQVSVFRGKQKYPELLVE